MKINIRFRQQRGGKGIRISFFIININDPGINQHLSADGTGQVRAVQDGAFHADTIQGGLNNGILFSMKAAAQFMPFSRRNSLFLPNTTNIQAMPDIGGRAVVAGCDDPFIPDDNSSHLSSQASGAFGHQLGDIHEILIPGGPFELTHHPSRNADKSGTAHTYP